MPYLADGAETQRLNQQAVAPLLDRIGPAIILTHSQSGPFGWLIADARPKLVKAVVAVEPAGPPLENAAFQKTDIAAVDEIASPACGPDAALEVLSPDVFTDPPARSGF